MDEQRKSHLKLYIEYIKLQRTFDEYNYEELVAIECSYDFAMWKIHYQIAELKKKIENEKQNKFA